MADNPEVANSPTTVGPTLIPRGIDKSGAIHQVVVVDIGGGGAESLLTNANPMPVTDADNGAILQDIQSLITTGNASLNAIDANTDDIEIALTALSVVGGGTEATAQRVTIASDSTGVLSVDDNGSTLSIDDGAGSITVDNGGTFAVQAAQSGTWNITNISGTISLPTGASTAANQTTIIGHVDGIETLLGTIDTDTGNIDTSLNNIEAVATVTGGGTETGVLRVTIANNSTGVLSVDDNGSTLSIDDGGGTITVDGTIITTPESATTPATGPTGSVVNCLTSATTLIASNANRKKAFIQNVGNNDVYVKFGSGASTTTSNVLLDSKSQYLTIDGNIYTGIITGIAITNAQDVIVWEVT